MKKILALAPIFKDNMVLQREHDIPVWGLAPTGAEVEVTLGSNSKKCIVADDRWRLDMPELQVGGPYVMSITCKFAEKTNTGNVESTDIIVLKNVVCGDVWIAGGQSNMEYALINSRHGFEERASANYPEIRFYEVPRITHENIPQDPDQDRRNNILENASSWDTVSQSVAGRFYAVAYSFAKDLHLALDIPIGIIECAWGGTSASCWLSRETLTASDELAIYWDEYESLRKDLDWDKYERQNEAYDSAMKKANQSIKDIPVTYDDMDAYYANIAFAAFPWPPALGPKSPLRPCGLYNTMFKKMTPYAAKGVIFYQGESDTHRPASYYKLFHAMMADWRRDLETDDLPFLMVQLAAFGSEDPNGLEYALLREQQTILGSETNCGTVVAMDIGHPTNIHPLDKRTVGKRLAAMAKGKVYHLDEPFCNPEYLNMSIRDDKAIVSFSNTYGSLHSKEPVKGFAIAGKNRKFLPANAVIQDDKIVVWSDDVSEPVAVRYGFANYMEVNLENGAGFPAVPFRTDDWI